ncbi:hypothetical protein ID866_7361 [Astraeus odoratus]|nr:hypothetical protein ID866_7361 [Astraeus odoratus]
MAAADIPSKLGEFLLRGWVSTLDLMRHMLSHGSILDRTVYVTEGSSEGWQHLVPISSASVLQEPVSALTPNGLSDNGPTQAVARNGLQPIQLPTLDPVPQNKLAVGIRVTPEPRDSRLVTPAPAHDVAANASAQALELALGILSERLSLACANPRLLDPSSVAETADAIGKVAQALTQVNYLRQHAAMESSSIS